MKKTIERILAAPAYHWVGNGFKVHNYMPQALGSNTRMSPFFMLDYNPTVRYEPSDVSRGVGVHPHRGMETVTVAYKGKVAHHDSAGNSGVIGPGDVQWMTAGRGILHKEYHEPAFVAQGGEFQMVQLWVNLPAKYKMTDPAYQELPKDRLGRYEIAGSASYVQVIAGEYKGVTGPAKTFTEMNLLDAHLASGTAIDIDIKPSYNAGVLVLDGSLMVNGEQSVGSNTFVLMAKGAERITLSAHKDSVALILAGAPIEEEILPYGPFLMNTEAEIQQAFDDYHRGLFGTLDE